MVDSSQTYTLNDLRDWEAPGTWLAVLGSPVKHSLSPQMHNAALAEMASKDCRFTDWQYVKFDVEPQLLREAYCLLHAKGFKGVNLTVPHKIDVLQLIEDFVGDALLMGAVNTLIRTDNNYRGANTDGYGAQKAVLDELDFDFASGEPLHILGAGGAAQAIAVQFLTQGKGPLWIGNRSSDRLEKLLEHLRSIPEAQGRLNGYRFSDETAQHPDYGLIINATSQGLDPAAPAPILLDKFDPKRTKVYDTIYNPPITALLRDAVTLGMPSANGLSMLVHQGAKSLEYWSGAGVPVEAMLKALR